MWVLAYALTSHAIFKILPVRRKYFYAFVFFVYTCLSLTLAKHLLFIHIILTRVQKEQGKSVEIEFK